MPTPDQPTQIDETDAKAATNNGMVRWVLVISLALAIAALTVIWMTGALSQDPVESEVNVQRKQEAAGNDAASEESSIDGITSNDSATVPSPSS